MPYRLAIFETHPIQYKVPWFRALARHTEIDLTVFYCMIPDARQQGAGFGVDFQWDIPLLEGYRYVVLENVAKHPGLRHFGGCDTPSIRQALEGSVPTEHTEDTEVASGSAGPRGHPEAGGRRPEVGMWEARSVAANLSGASPQLPVPVPHPSAFAAVIINGWVVKSCLQALWACRRAGVPAILRCEACDLQPRAWWKTVIHRALLRQFSAFIAIGKANRDFYLRRGVPAERIVDGFYCVDGDAFAKRSRELRAQNGERMWEARSVAANPVPATWEARSVAANGRNALRHQWGIPEDAVCFLFCGKFEAKKRPMDILRALARLGTEGGSRPGVPLPGQGRKAPAFQDHAAVDQSPDIGVSIPERQAPSPEHQTQNSPPPAGAPHGVARPGNGTPGLPIDASTPGVLPQLSAFIPHPFLHLLMVGDGELRDECEAYAREYSLPVTFAGFVNQGDMPGAYAAADCLILPSDHGETWGLVVNEAMACGLPAIVSDHVGCHPDLVIEGRTGHVFPCGDVEAMARLLRTLAGAPAGLQRMGEAARQHVQEYSIAHLAEGTLAALRLACAPRS
jgi:glycosyltransferase involved in cell wall biosynthesis